MSQTQTQTQQQRKITVPPMRYRLAKLTQEETLTQIGSLTRGFYDLPADIANWIQNDVRSREFSSFGYIPAPLNVDMVKQIIGIDGYYLKLTTKNHGVNFIWHDRAKNEFQFWGEYQRCIWAMNEIRYRICKYVEQARAVPILSNDVQPNTAVCFEAVFHMDTSGDVRTIASKHYPKPELE